MADQVYQSQASLDDILTTQKNGVVAINALAAVISEKFPDWVDVPGTATSTGTAGQVAYDTGFLYVCVSSNVWRRVAIAVF